MRNLVLVGLGNPGGEYAAHRHNIGFMVVDQLASDYHADSWSAKFGGHLATATHADCKLHLFKPLRYMNRSGGPVGELCRFFKIPPEDVIVFHDELDLPTGKVRVKQGGGHGGHNGLRDIDANIGKDYHRVRIGIGHPGDKDRVSPYVLSNFAKDEQTVMQHLIEDISRHINPLLQGDESGFMNKLALAAQ